MSHSSPNKSSGRAGRFKKKLVSEAELLKEAPEMAKKLVPFQELYTSGELTQAEFTACYILLFLSHRFPGNWLGAKQSSNESSIKLKLKDLPFSFEPNIQKRLPETLGEVFSQYTLKSTPLAVNRAVLEWANGRYGLELMFRIPRPEEVLDQQKRGRRCVTAIIDSRLSTYILGERDALSFIMHDLIHADHFYYHNGCYEGQLGFYGLLDKTISHFDLSNEEFASEFEYLIADMNAYAIHLMKCLKSAMVHYFSEAYYIEWLKSLNPPHAMYELNTENYSPVDMDHEILNWLDQFRLKA